MVERNCPVASFTQ